LGIPNHDIDLAIDNMSGVQFATILKEYLVRNNLCVSGMGIIQVGNENNLFEVHDNHFVF